MSLRGAQRQSNLYLQQTSSPPLKRGIKGDLFTEIPLGLPLRKGEAISKKGSSPPRGAPVFVSFTVSYGASKRGTVPCIWNGVFKRGAVPYIWNGASKRGTVPCIWNGVFKRGAVPYIWNGASKRGEAPLSFLDWWCFTTSVHHHIACSPFGLSILYSPCSNCTH